MRISPERVIKILALIVVGLFSCSKSFAVEIQDSAALISPAETEEIIEKAYVYGYPLITMEMTRRVLTNTVKPEGKYAPMGQFAHLRNYPSPTDREVTAPNSDTLYSLAWLNLSKEPYVLEVPTCKNRFYLLPMLDAWTEVFADPGTRTGCLEAKKYVITGPGWKGNLPSDAVEYKSYTNLVWILGRTYCNADKNDYEKVHAFQDALDLRPLSAIGKSYSPIEGVVDPLVDMKTPIRDQVNKMDAQTYFALLNQLMEANPPVPEDRAIISQMNKVGIGPGKAFDLQKLPPSLRDIFEGVPGKALNKIQAHLKDAVKPVNGWSYFSPTGNYGTDYLQRAFITYFGLGANKPEDAVYPTSENDADGNSYDGSKKYVLHFAKGELPPVKGFWSLTMYDDQFFFVPNELNRYSVGSHSHFKFNKDSSLDILIQKEAPAKERRDNWLPAPADKFKLMLRMYWPKAEFADGKYVIPPVKQERNIK